MPSKKNASKITYTKSGELNLYDQFGNLHFWKNKEDITELDYNHFAEKNWVTTEQLSELKRLADENSVKMEA